LHDLITDSPHKPLLSNTWGDALYGVFASVQDAGNFALELRDRICATNWEAKGLPRDINLRISLHAGPVYYCQTSCFGELRYFGSHVVRAARIEPITPSGQVYASQQFAALAASQRLRGFACEYVGQIPLPKSNLVVPLFRVRPTRP
jgi:class 3 adenylate cyclase